MQAVQNVADSDDTLLYYQTPKNEPVQYFLTSRAPTRFGSSVHGMTLNPSNPEEEHQLREALPDVVHKIFYAPYLKPMSGRVLHERRFSVIRQLRRGPAIARPRYKRDSREWEPCDAVVLSEGKGFIGLFGGCTLNVITGVTAKGEKLCIVAHAGRDSIIDWHYLETGTPSRERFGVLGAAVTYARVIGIPARDLTLRSFLSIPPEAFPHDPSDERFGKRNLALLNFVSRDLHDEAILEKGHDGRRYFSLPRLIQRGAENLGIGTIETDLLTLPLNGAQAYTRHADPKLADNARNLVTLVRLQ
jgi:hypothetical protein